jgi:hypothetical protein
VIVTVFEITSVGVPWRIPAVVNVKPAGKVPLVTSQVKGPLPVAESCWLYATF